MNKNVITATRYHDISCGHRVAGHESKCAYLHGHNYRIHFTVAADLDKLGRVLDFSVIKSILCEWLETNWDHKFLAWEKDKVMKNIHEILNAYLGENVGEHLVYECTEVLGQSIVWVEFNPTAENIALFLLREVGPQLLPEGVVLTDVVVEETRKCSAAARSN